MQKISVLCCEKLSRECSGYRCFDAFNRRGDAFSIHDQNAVIAGFFTCNGCHGFTSDQYKLKFSQLDKSGVNVIHISLCVMNGCRWMDALMDSIPKHFTVIMGTHK